MHRPAVPRTVAVVCALVVLAVSIQGTAALDWGFGIADVRSLATRVAGSVAAVFHSGASFVERPDLAVRTKLEQEFRSQDLALEGIKDAIEMWYTDRSTGDFHPLVLAFSGTTGVGKTSSARAVSEAVLTSEAGVLELRGEEYSDPAQPSLMFQNSLKKSLVTHLQAHPKGAVVIFDEMQKARPEVLDVLLPAFNREDAHLSHKIGEYDVRVGCNNVIFIIISDIGVNRIQELAIHAAVTHEDVAHFQAALSKQLKSSLHTYWDGFAIGGHIQQGIAFLPLTHNDLTEIARAKLQGLGVDKAGIIWGALHVGDAVPGILTGKKYVTYETIQVRDGSEKQKFAKYGARDVHVSHHGSLGSLKAVLFKKLRPFDSTRVVHVFADGGELVVKACGGKRARARSRASGADEPVDPNTICGEVFRGLP